MFSKRRFFVTVIYLLISIISCGPLTDGQAGRLAVSSNLLSVTKDTEDKNKSKIEILNPDPNLDYTIEPEDTDKEELFTYKKYFDKSKNKVIFEFNAKGNIGQQNYIISSTSKSGAKKTTTVTVRVNDPMVLDLEGNTTGLLMKYTNKYDFVYNDSGTKASKNVSVYKPRTNSGWHALGSLFLPGTQADKLKKYPMVLLKDNSKDKDLLKSPKSYKLIWSDKGSDGDNNGSIWLPIPHRGYVALGVVAVEGYKKTKLSEIMTVREDYTTDGAVGDLLWDDGKSGATDDVFVYKIKMPEYLVINDSSKAPLLTQTVIACSPKTSKEKKDSLHCESEQKSVAKILLYKKLVIDKGINDNQPRLTGTEPYEGYDTYQAAVKSTFHCLRQTDGKTNNKR